MNTFRITSLVCGGLISLAGSSLLAQQPSSSATANQASPTQGSLNQNQSSSTQPGSSLQRPGAGLGSASSQFGLQSGQNLRLSNLMQASVQSQDGKSLGHLRDFTIDPQSGRIEFAILSLSGAHSGSSRGTLGTGADTSSSVSGARSATSDTTSRGAADTSTSGRETVPSARSSASGALGGGSSWASSATGKLVPVPWQLFSQNFSSSRIGTGTSTTSGTSATTSSSTIGSSASSAGLQTLVLNIDESKLQNAPSFDASNWNQFQQGSLDQQVYAHFGVSPMSGAGTPGSSISGQGTSGQDSSSRLHEQDSNKSDSTRQP
jgi:hypothetical protein